MLRRRGHSQWRPQCGLARGSGCNGLLSACYGVANVKQLRGLERARSAFFEPTWYHVFNFIWLGWSPGGLHFDEMDNVLVQVWRRLRRPVPHIRLPHVCPGATDGTGPDERQPAPSLPTGGGPTRQPAPCARARIIKCRAAWP